MASQGVDKVFDRSVQILLARPHYRRLIKTNDPGEKQRLRAELRARYPDADRWYEYHRSQQTRSYKGA